MLEIVIAFGIVAVAILGLIAVFLSGVQLSARSRDLTVGTELSRQVLEQVKLNVKSGGIAYVPPGPYSFDGKVPTPQVGAPPAQFPPAPYPVRRINNMDFFITVTGQDLGPSHKAITVDVSWDSSAGHVRMETHLHP